MQNSVLSIVEQVQVEFEMLKFSIETSTIQKDPNLVPRVLVTLV